MKKDKIKIILTGGHAGTTALSVVQEIQKQNLDWDIHWIGPKRSIEGKNTLSLEFKYFKKFNIKFHSILFTKLQRRFSIWSLLSFFKVPVGFSQALYFLLSIKPSLVLSFGGFAAFPVVLISKILNIPVIIHEQTSAAGRSNIISAKFSDKVLLSRETSRKYFSNKNIYLVGNPVISAIISKSELNKDNINKIKTILIMGGSRGSQIINTTVRNSLKFLLEKYKVIHITGDLDFSEFSEYKTKLTENKSENYTIYSSVDPFDMYKIFKKADVVISRAGANSVAELVLLGIPSIFIPIPWSYLDEQTQNAKYASKYINSIILDQNNLNSKELLDSIEKLINNIDHNKKGNSFDKEASEKIVSLLKKSLK